jgi:hypothetical protein
MVRATLRVVRHEPLVHFFLLGGLIFAADAVLHPPDRNERVITVTRAMRQAMSENFDEDRERKATGTELDAMVDPGSGCAWPGNWARNPRSRQACAGQASFASLRPTAATTFRARTACG